MKIALAALLLVALALPAQAGIKTETVKYKAGDTTLVGYLAYDDATETKRPGVLVVHEWWGLNDYAKKRAEQLAREGYVAFAVDMYGDGKSTPHPEDAGKWAAAVGQNKQLRRDRFLAGWEVLKGHKLTQPNKIAAIGYCFGGSTVLAMALSGADLKGVVSFHGSLPQEPAEATPKAKILVCHGADDSFITPEQIQTFQTNLRKSGADWEFISYGGALHSFTVPDAAKAGIDALAYNADADRRSWEAMRDFFKEIFAE